MKRRLKKKRAVLMRQMASFFALIVLLVIFFFVGSKRFQNILMQEAERANTNILKVINNELDEQVQNMEKMVSLIYSNTDFNEFCRRSSKNSAFYLKAEELRKTLHDFSQSTGLDCLIYFPKWEYAAAPVTANEIDILYNRQSFYGLEETEEEWVKALSTSEDGLFFSGEHSLQDYSQRMVMGKTVKFSNMYVKIYVSISSEWLKEISAINNSILMITDEKDEILACFVPEDTTICWTKDQNGLKLEAENGEDYICSYIDSTYCDWKYVVAVLKSSYYEAVVQGHKLLIGLIAFSSVAGLFFALLLTYVNYSPLYRMLNHIGGDIDGERGDEYKFILQVLQDIRSKSQMYQKRISRQSDQLGSMYMLLRLKGEKYLYKGKELNEYYSIKSKDRYWQLIHISGVFIKESEETFTEESESTEWLLFAIENVLSEVLDGFPHYIMQDGKELLFLLGLNEEQREQWEREKKEKIQFIKEFFKEHVNGIITGVVSSWCSDFGQIDRLYSETVKLRMHRRILGEVGFIFAEDYVSEQEGLFSNADLFLELEKIVSEGNSTEAEHMIRRIFSGEKYTDETFSVLRIEVNESMYRLISVFNEVSADLQTQNWLVNQALDIVIHTHSVSELQERFLETVRLICTVVGKRLEAENPVVAAIHEYIEENYNDMNLNITAIAAYLEKHPNYVSKIYYAETGTALLEYIHQVRIEHAKEILLQGNITIEKVAELCGFNTVKTFRRVFLKVTGLNPGEYQKKYR